MEIYNKVATRPNVILPSVIGLTPLLNNPRFLIFSYTEEPEGSPGPTPMWDAVSLWPASNALRSNAGRPRRHSLASLGIQEGGSPHPVLKNISNIHQGCFRCLWAWEGSNLRPRSYQERALPLSHTPSIPKFLEEILSSPA